LLYTGGGNHLIAAAFSCQKIVRPPALVGYQQGNAEARKNISIAIANCSSPSATPALPCH
jgi:hypothetical protein